MDRVHSKLKGQNSRTFQGLLKDLNLQFSRTKSIDKDISYSRCDHNHITFKTVLQNVNKQIICNTHWEVFLSRHVNYTVSGKNGPLNMSK